jgi:hypothetical protein
MCLLPTRPLTRKVLRWLFALLGILIALLGPVACRDEWVGEDPASPFWTTNLFQFAGVALLLVVFVAASFAALRHARRAGIIFLAGTPVLAFALAYPSAGYLVTHAAGDVDFQLPSLPLAIAVAILFYLPFVAPLFAMRNRMRATLIFAAAAAPAAVVFASAHWAMLLILRLAAWSALPLAFAAFWLGTHRLGWPALFATPTNPFARVSIVVVKCLLAAFLVLGGVFAMSAMQSSLWTPDCSGGRLFTRPMRSGDVVFTARVVRTAHTARIAGSWAGSWAVAIVEERLWGWPSWAPVVLLTNGMYWEGRTFLISGSRAYGTLARHLPIVDATSCGSHFAAPRRA